MITTDRRSELRFSSNLILLKNLDSGPDGVFIEANEGGRSCGADLRRDGSISFSIKGVPPHGEDGAVPAAERLIHRLNSCLEKGAAQWTDLKEYKGPETGIDCVASREQESLYIQVTRSLKECLWKSLHQHSAIEETQPLENVIDDLLGAIQRKREFKYSLGIENMVLVLDLADAPGHALPGVLREFRQRHEAAKRTFGFKEIWAVGPLSLIERLDL